MADEKKRKSGEARRKDPKASVVGPFEAPMPGLSDRAKIGLRNNPMMMD